MKITTKHVSNRPVTFVAHKRFAVLFVLPSCCVNSQICRAKSGIGSFSFTLTFSLSSAVTSRQVFVSQLSSAFIEKLFSRTFVLHANIFTNLVLHFLIEREYEKSMKCWFGFINNPTYTQIHTPTVVQGERVDGTPPRSFWYVAVFRNDFAFSGKPIIFSTRWSIIYGWWRCWRPVTSPTMKAI